ncbi:MAG: hypothetical protein GY861_21990 [bacterium]|nr:hypothetical protein [bacterium]
MSERYDCHDKIDEAADLAMEAVKKLWEVISGEVYVTDELISKVRMDQLVDVHHDLLLFQRRISSI